MLAIAVERFTELSRHFAHPPGRHGTPEQRRHYTQAQLELWNLAQTICGMLNPQVQSELDSARRELVSQLSRCVRTPVTGALVIPCKRTRPLYWRDIQITPEITLDPDLSGLAVLRPDLKRLKLALRAQNTVLDPIAR